MKKTLKILGGFALFAIAIAVVVPLVVDVDRYRPQILQAVNERIDGKVDMGRLTLSLWGRILVRIDGLRVQDSGDQEILSVNEAAFQIPLLSLLSASPKLVVKMKAPKLVVKRNRAGALNFMTLMKNQPTPQSSQVREGRPGSASSPASSEVAPGLPAVFARARLGLEVRDAEVLYWDQAQDVKNEFKGLNLLVKDLSLMGETDLELWGDLNTRVGKSGAEDATRVEGPFRISARVSPEFSGGHLQKGSAYIRADFDRLMIQTGDVFSKKSGIPAHMEIKAVAKGDGIQIETCEIRFHNLELKGSGSATGLQSSDLARDLVWDLKMSSGEIDLGPWSEVIPVLKGYDLSGVAKVQAQATGKKDALKYEARFGIRNGSAKGAIFKAEPKLDVDIQIATSEIQRMNLDFGAPGTSLRVRGTLKNFQAPDLRMTVTSDGMDLDQWIDFEKIASSARSDTRDLTESSKASGDSKASASETKAIGPAVADVKIDLPSLKAMNVVVSEIKAHLTMKNGVGKIDPWGFKVFDGAIAGTASFDLASTQTPYQMMVSVKNLNLDKAMKSQLEMFKNTATGSLSLEMKGAGKAKARTGALKALDAQGNFNVKDAKLSTVDVGRIAVQAVNKILVMVGDAVPPMRGKTVGDLKEFESRFTSMTGDFTLKDGVFKIPNFVARSRPGEGVDIEGQTTLNLVTDDLNAKWKIVDVHNMLRVRDIGVDVAGVQVPNILTEGNPPIFSIPMTLSGKMKAPSYDYASAPEYFAGVASRRVENAGKQRLKQEAIQKVQEVLPHAPPVLQDVIRKLPF